MKVRTPKSLRGRWYESPHKMWLESEAGLRVTEEHLAVFKEQVQQYHSQHFRRRGSGGVSFMENHYYDWVTYMVPRIAFNAPRAVVRSKISSIFGEDARALGAGLNAWVKDNRYEQFGEEAAIDMQFNWSVANVSQQPIPGARPIEGIDPEDPDMIGLPFAPKVYRILQDLYFEDANSRQRGDLRMRGHCFARDKNDLISEAKLHPERGWNRNVIESLSTGDANERLGRDSAHAISRDELVLREIWVPEAELDEYWDGTEAPEEGWREAGFNGLIFTISSENTDEWVRPPRPAYVPPSGGYAVFGCFGVPNSPRMLAPLVAVEEQVRELNRHARSVSDSARDYKRMAFIEDSDPKIARMIRDGKHHGVYPVKGFKRENLHDIEVGGVSDQLLVWYDRLKDRLDRNAHMDDPTRGKTTGSTAHEADLASRATETRTEWVERKYVEGHVDVLTKVLYFMYRDNRSVWPIGAESAQEAGVPPQRLANTRGEVIEVMPSLSFQGGYGAQPGAPPFEALQLEVEPRSTRRPNEDEARMQFLQGHQFLMETIPLIAAFPWVKWKKHYEQAALALAQPELEEAVDFEVATKEGPNTDMLLPSGPVLQNPRTGATSPSAKPGQLPALSRSGGGRRTAPQAAQARSQGGAGKQAGKGSPKVGASLSAV